MLQANLAAVFNLSVRVFRRVIEIPVRGFPRGQSHNQPAFDRELGVDTSGIVWLTNPQSKNFTSGFRYEPCHPELCTWSIEHAGIDPKDFCFVDVGCGKGRQLIVASKYNFSELIGVEYSSQLCGIAKANLRKLDIHGKVECQDAVQFTFPECNVFAFFYNPFGPVILDQVLRHLPASREVVVAYAGPGRDAVAQQPWLKPYAVHDSVTVFRNTPMP
jgi:SAM-dependent methyltransferase